MLFFFLENTKSVVIILGCFAVDMYIDGVAIHTSILLMTAKNKSVTHQSMGAICPSFCYFRTTRAIYNHVRLEMHSCAWSIIL
jgi:hypothetical protein